MATQQLPLENQDAEPPADLELAADFLTSTGQIATAEQKEQALAEREAQLVAIDEAIKACSGMMAVASSFSKSMILARGIAALERQLTPAIMAEILPLMNSPLGFLTDKDPAKEKDGKRPEPYSEEIVKRCVIEVLLHGGRFVGNEMNIIASRAYLAKNFYVRAVFEFPGLTDFRQQYGTPTTRGGATVVDCKASWKMHGQPQSLDRTGPNAIPIIVSGHSTPDQNLGKAERKLLRAVYQQLTGSKDGLNQEGYDPEAFGDDGQTMLADARNQDQGALQQHPVDDVQRHPDDNGSQDRPSDCIDPWALLESRYMQCNNKADVAKTTAAFRKEQPDLAASEGNKLKTMDSVHQKRVGTKK